MTKHLSIIIFLLLATVIVACASESPVATTATAPAATNPPPTEPASSPTPVMLTVVPVAQPVAGDDVMTVGDEGDTTVDTTSLDNVLSQQDSMALNEQEVADLLFMREEEKLAHDVYLTLYEQWGLRIFQNIANSELTHTEAIRTLLVRYDLADPALDRAVGVFANEGLQALYDQLVAQGSQSLVAALQVGATIEDLDIVDLQNAVARTDNADIVLVYENLMKGSRNHLRAFIATLQKQNGEYQPQYLDQAAYEAIISSPMERGK